MDKPILSVCVSSYNRGRQCRKLVERILSLNNPDVNIFISDDHSEEKHIKELKKVFNSCVYLAEHEHNMGPCKNWYESINMGNGKYLLHVLDRDEINLTVLAALVELLKRYEVSGGYLGYMPTIERKMQCVKGDKIKYHICQAGYESTILLAGIPFHPTGFFIKRELWKRGEYRKYFYNETQFGIYPHSYVLGRMAINNDLIYVQEKFYVSNYRKSEGKSSFYKNSKTKTYWWIPKNVFRTSSMLISELLHYIPNELRESFISARFEDCLYRASIGYKYTIYNVEEMGHYGLEIGYAYSYQLYWISFKCLLYYFKFFYMQGMLNVKVVRSMLSIWRRNNRRIKKG